MLNLRSVINMTANYWFQLFICCLPVALISFLIKFLQFVLVLDIELVDKLDHF